MFTVMGITGNVGGAVAENLLAAGKKVRGVVRNPEKAKAWVDRGVELVQSAYDDAAGHVEIYAEWGGTPTEVILYKQSLNGMATSRVNTVLSNVTRALKYLGHRVQVRSDH